MMHVGMALTTPSLTMQYLMSGMDVFVHVFGQPNSGHFCNIFSHMTTDVSVFVNGDMILRSFLEITTN